MYEMHYTANCVIFFLVPGQGNYVWRGTSNSHLRNKTAKYGVFAKEGVVKFSFLSFRKSLNQGPLLS